jgi:UDP-N-acetylglucosamine 2-epimerase (non-hydrolysing)
VDSPDALGPLIDVLIQVSDHLPIVFPVHPRTRARLDAFGLNDKLDKAKGFHVLEPLGYNDFLCLTSQARVIVTDSGGLQEESTALEIPCLTMRQNTERPVTVTEGTSTLCGSSASLLNEHLAAVLSKGYKVGKCPPLWDGNAAVRIVAELMSR